MLLRIHICGRDKSAPTAANGLPFRCKQIAIMQRTHREIPTLTHEMGCEHSARRRGRFIAPVSLDNQIYIFALPNTCIHIITHISTLSNMCIFVIKYTYSHYQICVSTLSDTCIHTTARTFPPPFLWVNTDMRAR